MEENLPPEAELFKRIIIIILSVVIIGYIGYLIYHNHSNKGIKLDDLLKNCKEEAKALCPKLINELINLNTIQKIYIIIIILSILSGLYQGLKFLY